MRKYAVLLMMLLLAQISTAAEAKRSVGLILGAPTGLSAKWWVKPSMAWDAAVGWDISGDGFFYLHADYLLHNRDMIRKMDLEAAVTEGDLLFYYGLGVRVEAGDDSRLGGRLPLGLEYFFADVPLEGFIEIGPLLDLLPKTAFRLQGGVGIRYLF